MYINKFTSYMLIYLTTVVRFVLNKTIIDDVTPRKALSLMLQSATTFFPTMLSVPVTLLVTSVCAVTAILI